VEDPADGADEEFFWFTVPMARAVGAAVRSLEGMLEATYARLGAGEVDPLPGNPMFLPVGYPYTREVIRKFLYCLVTVSARLDGWQRQWAKGEDAEVGCASVAEELMLHAIGREAESLLEDDPEQIGCTEEDVKDADWSTFHSLAFEDADFCVLFESGGKDVVVDKGTADYFGISSMSFDDWFKPFGEARGVSPLCWEGSLPHALYDQDPELN